jgi:hypothetical protein
MTDEEKTPISEENSLPTSPQEPTEPIPINSTDLRDSHPSVPVEGLGADGDDLKGVEYDNIPPPEGFEGENTPLSAEKPLESPDSTPPEPEKEPENQASQPSAESESIQADKQTPQIPVNEAFEKTQDEALPESEPSVSEAKEEPKPQTTEAKPPLATSASFALALLVKARNVIQFRKRKKLDRIMSLFLKQSKITNDEVEKFLHVSDATATRYLSQLEKEGKIKQHGRTGAGVSYSRI